jgi:hypothetical protein
MADARARWAASGAMWLTGDLGGPPLVAPDSVVEAIEALGAPLGIDARSLLGERAALAGLTRGGRTSCGGAARLLSTPAGWCAVSLARPEDVELLPAWLGIEVAPEADPWEPVADRLAGAEDAPALLLLGRELGLPVSMVGEVEPVADPVVATSLGDAPPDPGRPLVLDLSSLWAGPLCANLLGMRDAVVLKVESIHRPDGARHGPQSFFDLLHGGHHSIGLDLRSPSGVADLRSLLATAHVVIEASRPRALQQLGIDALDPSAHGAKVWVSITGHGRDQPLATAFGDDAAAAGGLVAWGEDGEPRFVADAVADPLTGVVAAARTASLLASDGRWLLDIAMSRVAAAVAAAGRPVWESGRSGEAAKPMARPVTAAAPALRRTRGLLIAGG